MAYVAPPDTSSNYYGSGADTGDALIPDMIPIPDERDVVVNPETDFHGKATPVSDWLQTSGDDETRLTGYGGNLPEDQPGGETYDWNSYHGIGDRSNTLSATPEHQSVALTPQERLARFGVSGKSTGRPFTYNGQTYYDDDTAAQFFKGRDEGRRIDVYQGGSGGVMDEHDTPETKISELPEHLDLENWDQPHNISSPAPQETVEAPPVAKRSLIQEFHDKYPNETGSDQGILAQMHALYAPTMPEEEFKVAATSPDGRDIIKDWQERTKTPLEQIRGQHPEWSNYSDDKLIKTLYSEWTKNKQIDAGKMSLSQFRERMNPTTDWVNQTAKFIEQVKAEIPSQTASYGAWAVSGTEQHALDTAEPTIRGILAKVYSPDTDLDQLFKKYQGMNPEERKKEFAQAWSTLKQGGSDSASLFDQLNTTFETIDKSAQIQESIGWMKKAIVKLDAPGPYQLAPNSEQWVKTIAGLPVQAVAGVMPGFREMSLFGNLYAHNKASIEQNNPGMASAEVIKRAENATWWQFPGNELLQLSFLRGGPEIAGTIINRLKGIGFELGKEAAFGAGVGGANQVITNIAAGRDPLFGVGQSVGTMATLGLAGRGLGLTVEGLTRAQTQVPEIRRATGISADIVGATPEEANKIVNGDPNAEVNLKATRNSIDLILSAHAQREAEKGNVPAWQVAREAEIAAKAEKTPASEAFDKAQTARNNGDLKTAQEQVDKASSLLNGEDKKKNQEDVADAVKGLTKKDTKTKLKNLEGYMGLNDPPGKRVKRGEQGAAFNPFGGRRRIEKRSDDANVKMARDVGLDLEPAVRLGDQVTTGSDHWDAAQAFSQLHGGSSLRRSGLGLSVRLPSKTTEDLPATGVDVHNLEQGYIGPRGKFFTRDQVSQLIRDSRQQTFHREAKQGEEEAEAFSGGNPLPFVRKAAQGFRNTEQFKGFFDGISRNFAPWRRSESAKETAGIVIEKTGRIKTAINQGLKIIAEDMEINKLFHDAYRFDRQDAFLNNYSDAELDAMIIAKERGQKLDNPVLDKVFDYYRACYDWLEYLGRKYGVQFGHFENFFHHSFKNTGGEVSDVFRKWEPRFGKQAFQKTRHYPNLADALEAGLVPKSHSPVRNLMTYAAAMVTAIRQVDTLKSMAEYNLALPKDEARDPDFLKRQGWSLYDAPDDNSYYVRDDRAGVLANAFDLHSIYDTMAGPFVAFARAMKVVTGIKLSWSVFHPIHIAINTMGETLSTSMERASNKTGTAQDFWDAFNAAVTLGVHPMAQAYRKHAWLIDALTTGKGLENLGPNQMRDYADVTEMALNPYMGDDRLQVFSNMIFRGWKGARQARDTAEFLYRWAMMEPFQEWMFGKVIPCVKIAAALARRDTLIAKYGEEFRSPENYLARKRAYFDINRDVEGRFGEMCYDNLFWNRLAKQVGTAVPLSLGWNLGFWRMYGDGVVDYMDNAAHIAKLNLDAKKAPGLSNRLLYMTNYTVGSMVTNGLITYLMSGTMPQGADYFFPRIGKKANGDDERVRTPFWTGEWASMYAHFQEHHAQGLTALVAGGWALADYFGNKANPGLASIWHLMNNKTFMGRDIYDLRDPWPKPLMDVLGFVLKDMLLPISVQNMQISGRGIVETDAKGIPNDPKQVIMSFLGFTQAPGYTTRTELQNKIITMFHTQMNMHMGKRESDIFDAKTRYQYAIQAGDQAMQAEELSNLRQLGAHDKLIRDARENANVPPAHRAWKGLTWENQSYLLKQMSPSEYHEYWPITKPDAKMDYIKTE